jgi:hypothetical protein
MASVSTWLEVDEQQEHIIAEPDRRTDYRRHRASLALPAGKSKPATVTRHIKAWNSGARS